MECSHFGQTVVNAALIFARLIFSALGKRSLDHMQSAQSNYKDSAPARPVLWFVQLCLLVFGQALLDDFQLLKSIFEHGLFRVFLSDTDRR